MSELIQNKNNRAAIRLKLLAGVSALALTIYVSSASVARAEDAGQPQLWIELGGQLSKLSDSLGAFAPDFPASLPRPSIFTPSQKFERPALYGFDEYAKISFQPEASDWILSGAIRYGRSARNKNVREQTNPKPFYKYITGYTAPPAQPIAARFADTNARTSERQLIVDFQVGKDVGLGMFGGKDGSSVLSLGVRFAQFASKSNIMMKSDPDWHFSYKYFYGHKVVGGQHYHSNAASLRASRSFHGIGPSLSWNASAPLAGNLQDSQLALDWGVNAALLFGRQRAKVHHQTTAQSASAALFSRHRYVTGTPVNTNHARSRSVTVPNVGGFAGLSYRTGDFKVSFGYRADMFFGAIDGGIDSRKNETRGFFGPFASMSVGIGD